jgi:GNAT superfamily N-acetyltransferase
METTFHVRPAVAEEAPVLRDLIEMSVRKLQAEDYSVEQRENALKTVFGVDSQLVADGTYLVVEARFHYPESDGGVRQQSREKLAAGALALGLGVDLESIRFPGPVIVACGGWSKRKTLYGGDKWHAREDALLDPRVDAVKIRAFFIHPGWARRGIGTLLLDACEKAARGAGFTRFEMGATLTGAKLFGARGYKAVKNIEVPIGAGLTLPVIHMEKTTD